MKKYLSDYPEIASQFHPTKNGDMKPNQISHRNNKVFHWICEKGHEWSAPASNRTRQAGNCPYCVNRFVCKDNSFAVIHKDHAVQWHPTKNGDITPEKVTANSRKKYWWLCEKGHDWHISCFAKTRTGECNLCKPKTYLINFPEVIKQWHPTKNGNIIAEEVEVTKNNKIKYWWLCEKGHETQTGIIVRINHRCGYCTNQKPCHENCLTTLYPNLAKEFHPIKNGNLTANDVIAKSQKKYWWLCEKGHEWKAAPGHRIYDDNNCPICKESKGERKIRLYLEKHHKQMKSEHIIKGLCRFDFVVAINKKLAVIEYQGEQHYWPISYGSKKPNAAIKNLTGNVIRDLRKKWYCESKRIPLLLIPYWDYNRIDEILDDYFAGHIPTFSPEPEIVKKYQSIREKIVKKVDETLVKRLKNDKIITRNVNDVRRK